MRVEAISVLLMLFDTVIVYVMGTPCSEYGSIQESVESCVPYWMARSLTADSSPAVRERVMCVCVSVCVRACVCACVDVCACIKCVCVSQSML